MAQFSFVVPIYKVDYDYLKNCVKSLREQTLQDIEIVLVDDGSPDECGKICDELAQQDQRIKVVHKKNGGLSDARNAGTDVVTTPWVTYVDGDDWVDLDFAESFINRIQQQEEMAEVYIYSGYRNYAAQEEVCYPYFSDGTRFKTYEEREKLQAECCLIFTKGKKEGLFIGSAWAKVYSTDFLKSNNLKFTIVPYGEDSIFYLQFIEKASCVEYVSKPVYHYRDTEGGMVNKYRSKADDEQIIYLKEIFDFAEKSGKSQEFIDTLYFRVFVSMQRVISQKFANPNNPDGLWKRHIECDGYFHTEPYKGWYKHIKYSTLNRNSKIKYILLRIRFYFVLDYARNIFLKKKGRVHMEIGGSK